MSLIKQNWEQELLTIKRPCLIVSNLQRSLKLYQDILGFELIYQNQASPDSYLYRVFSLPLKAQVTFAAFNTLNEPRALALVEVKAFSLPARPMPYSCALVIQVSSLESRIAAIRELGLAVIEPNRFKTEHNLSFIEQALSDFDGNRIMLYQQVDGRSE